MIAASFLVLRLSASRPCAVFALWTMGNNDSANSGKPPLPDFLSEADAAGRRNASTATMMNAAEAISATHNTVRLGRRAALRNPSSEMVHQPIPLIGFRFFLFNQAAK